MARSHTLKIRLDDDELAMLNAKADKAGKPPAVFLRDQIQSSHVVNRSNERDLIALTAGCMNHLEILSRWVSRFQGGVQGIEIKAELVKIHRALKAGANG